MSLPSRHAVAADVVFDGEGRHDHFAVVVENAQITALTPRYELPSSIAVHNLTQGAWLAPGFIDIQVNGGGDVLFNADPTPAALAKIAEAHRKFGVTAFLPTLITDSDETMAAALGAVSAVMGSEPSILGIHLEGPFLSPEKPGVHRREFIRRPQPHHRQMLGSLRDGVLLVTLAPEEMPKGFVAELVALGAKVSLGHSIATYEQTRAAMAEGLTGFTHLFNAMRPLFAREPGPVAAALEASHAYYGLIVDGEHVAPAMLGLAMRGVGRPMLVSDAMPPVGGVKRDFDLLGRRITVRNGSCRTQDGELAGSFIEMASAIRNCVRLLGLPLERALRCASTNPAKFLGLGQTLGRLAPGYRADMVAFDPKDILVSAAWVAGGRSDYPPAPSSATRATSGA